MVLFYPRKFHKVVGVFLTFKEKFYIHKGIRMTTETGSFINTLVIRKRIQDLERELDDLPEQQYEFTLKLMVRVLKLYANDKVRFFKDGRFHKHYDSCDIINCSCHNIDYLVEHYLVQSSLILDTIQQL